MALLTPQDIQGIRDAIQLVTDQFFVTPCRYSFRGESMDPYEEDRKTGQHETVYNLMCLFEYLVEERNELQETEDGGEDQQQVKCTFNLRDLKAAGCIDAQNEPIFQTEKDYFTVNGKTYKVIYVGLDGPLEQEQVLVVMKGREIAKQTD